MYITKFVVSQDDIRLVQDELNSLGFIFYLVLFIIVTMAIVQIILYIKYLKSEESTIPFLLISGIPICISFMIGLVGIETNHILIAIEASLQMLITVIIMHCILIIDFCRLLIVIVSEKRKRNTKKFFTLNKFK